MYTFLNIGIYIDQSNLLPVRIVMGVWLLAMVVLVNAYAGLLTACMTVPKLKPTVETFKDLVDNHQMKVTIELNSDLSYQFLVIHLSLYNDYGLYFYVFNLNI